MFLLFFFLGKSIFSINWIIQRCVPVFWYYICFHWFWTFHLRKVYDVKKLKNPLQIVNCILFLQADVEFVCRLPWKIVYGVAVFREVNFCWNYFSKWQTFQWEKMWLFWIENFQEFSKIIESEHYHWLLSKPYPVSITFFFWKVFFACVTDSPKLLELGNLEIIAGPIGLTGLGAIILRPAFYTFVLL